MTSEAEVKARIRIALGANPAIKLFNNPVGMAKVPKTGGGWADIRIGLAPGSPDLIGWKSVSVTADMIGRTVAVFAAVEVKNEKGRLRDDQVTFIELLKKAGAIVGVARSPEEAFRIMEVAIGDDQGWRTIAITEHSHNEAKQILEDKKS